MREWKSKIYVKKESKLFYIQKSLKYRILYIRYPFFTMDSFLFISKYYLQIKEKR